MILNCVSLSIASIAKRVVLCLGYGCAFLAAKVAGLIDCRGREQKPKDCGKKLFQKFSFFIAVSLNMALVGPTVKAQAIDSAMIPPAMVVAQMSRVDTNPIPVPVPDYLNLMWSGTGKSYWIYRATNCETPAWAQYGMTTNNGYPVARTNGAVAFYTVIGSSNVSLTWSGSLSPNIVGYNIYYGTIAQTFTNEVSVGVVTNLVLSNLMAATYFFMIRAINSSGIESGFSNQATDAVPLMPRGLRIAL